ncbi:uncharacterized protein Tco025E_07605 [Trypanosoma conorhini]|uniref:Uncharacterized protein n=1 Tax=Trypanosoma conorhini TaxID=83891 RepID=A0A422NLC5_9TRYP|nr:uncharacterized protein Tco025E_07605 [Trypanosoma conorhini]RNF06290.1 hypothetical protein Tco025E_07605 [Trypanosoma conorhini]
MDWKPPVASVGEEQYTTFTATVFVVSRSFTAYFPAINEFMRQFNQQGSALYRMRSLGSRLHFGLRASCDQVYAVPFWPHRTIFAVEAENALMLYHPWCNRELEGTSATAEVHVRTRVLFCKAACSFDGPKGRMLTEASLITLLPRVVNSSRDAKPREGPGSNALALEIVHEVTYGVGLQKEALTIVVKGQDVGEVPQIYKAANDTKPTPCLTAMKPFVISLEEAYHFSAIVCAVLASASPQQLSVEAYLGRERSLKLSIAPSVAYSPRSFDVAFVSWEGIDFTMEKNGSFEGHTVALSLLCDASLRSTEHQDMTTLWGNLLAVKKTAAAVEIVGSCDTAGSLITLKKTVDAGTAALCIGGVFLHLTEQRLPLLFNQLVDVYKFLSSGFLPLPLSPRQTVIAAPEKTHASMLIHVAKVHLGFVWYSRMNGTYGELQLALRAVTWRSDGALTLENGGLQLKWFDAAPPGESMSPCELLLREASDTVPLIENVSLSTQASSVESLCVTVSPIHMNLAFDTYLNLVELVAYHLRVELRNPVRGASEEHASVAAAGHGALAWNSSFSSASPLFSAGNEDAFPSFFGTESVPQAASTSPAWQYSLKLAELSLTVAKQRHVHGAGDVNSKPFCWLRLTNVVFDLFPSIASFALREVSLSCVRGTSAVALSGVQFSSSRTAAAAPSLPEMVCIVQSMVTRLFTPDLWTCFDCLVRTPAEELAELYWGMTHPSGSDILCRPPTGSGASGRKGNHRRLEVVTVDTPVWELRSDLVLSRNCGSVLQFASVNTNNIHVEMRGHAITIETPRNAEAAIVVVVDAGLSLTFSDGRFVLPSLPSSHSQVRRRERLGEEALLLPFMALGECSYVRCLNVSFAATEREERHQHAPPLPPPRRQQHDRATGTVQSQRWKAQVGIQSVMLHVASKKGGGVKATVAVEARMFLRGWTIEQGEVALENLSVITHPTASATSANSTTATTGSSGGGGGNAMGACTTDNVLIAPVSLHLCISEGRQFAFVMGRIVADAMVSDVLLLSTMTHELVLFARHAISSRYSPMEQAYNLEIERVLGWKLMGLRGGSQEDGGARHRDESQSDEPPHAVPALALAAFFPFMELTLSNVKYPLLQLALSDVVWKENVFRTNRTTLLQSQHLFLRVYGKGRWDTVIPPRAVISLEAVRSWSRRTRTEQVELRCEGFVLHVSHLLLSKLLHIRREWLELYATMLEHSHRAGEPPSPLSSASVPNPDTTATHRFINVFDDVFYLFVGKDLEHGEIVPLPSCTAVDLTLPFNRADDVRLYLYPRHCVELDEHGRHVRNSEGLRRDMQYCHVVASQLQYGRAFGLVMDDLLVVMSCIETDGAPTAVTPLAAAYAGASLYGDSSAAPLIGTRSAAAPGSGFTNASSMASVRGADEAGLVVVRFHSQRTLCNGVGMVIEVRQYILGDPEETPASDDFWIVPPNAEYPLLGLCSRVELRLSLDGCVYCTSLSTLSLESGVVLTLQPIGDAATPQACHSRLPVCLFMALQRFAASGSAVIHLLPRMTVLNHIGVPVKLSLWQEEESAPRRRDDGVGSIIYYDRGERGSSSVDAATAAAAGDQASLLWPRWGGRDSRRRRRLIRVGGHGALPHRGALPICQCSYSGGLSLRLSFTQAGGETLQTGETVTVCSSLKRRVGREPCLVRLLDSSGRSFYVQVAVLHRTLLLSVGHWVINLTEYPVLLTDSAVSRRLTAGQLMHTGIPPSQGLPFLVGSRPAEFTVAFLKLGLDGDWSGAIETRVGSHGVAESPRCVVGGLTRSCNYVIQFPRVQEGRPVVLLLTPRWVFINNANRRLKVHFAFPAKRRSYSSKRPSAGEHTPPPQTATAATATTTTEAGTQPLSFLTLRPGEHHFSCLGTATGNVASFQDTLEDAAPSITSFSNDAVRHTNLAEFYEVHRTAPISVDGPCHATFNLWASLRQPEVAPSVVYGARTTGAGSFLPPPQLSAGGSHFGEDVAFVTGRISVTVQHIDNVLAVVIDGIHATNMVIQNRARGETLAVRQKGSQRRTVIPPCQNRFFLWEDYSTDPVISLHVIGHKGAWFEVDFSRGDCQVQRRHTSDATAEVLSPFSLRACTSASNAQHVTILFTDESLPPHAFFDDAWHTSVGHTLSFPALELLWLTEERPGRDKPHVSLMLRDLQVQTLAAGNTHTISVILRRLQVVDVRAQAAVVLHRASPATPNAAEAMTSGGILSWFWRGEEVPPQDLQAVYAAMISASGVTRVTELSFVLAPFAVYLSDHFIVSVWYEYRGLLSLFADSGGKQALAAAALASPWVSRHEFSQGLVARLHGRGNGPGGPAAGATSAAASAAITTAAHSKQRETHDGPALLFVDQARFSSLTVFLTFSRHKPDPLWGLLGIYTLMIPKRLRQMEVSWKALAVDNSATTWGLLLAQAQHWLMDGALRQWPKVTRLGKIVDKFKGGSHRRVTLADTPPPMLSDVDNFRATDDDEEDEED